MEALWALVLTAALVLCALPAGALCWGAAGAPVAPCVSRLERMLICAALGLGAFALLLSLAGFAGVLITPLVLGLPALLGVAGLPFARGMWHGAAPQRGEAPAAATDAEPPERWSVVERAIGGLLALLGLAVATRATAPPADYDGLLYHLVAPRAYLAAHAIVYLPHNFSANLPMFAEMLYAIPLAVGADRAPQLLHGVAGALSVGLTFVLGAQIGAGAGLGRGLSRRVGLWSAGALASTPLLPLLSERAYIDQFTLLFGTLVLWGVLRWRQDGRLAWLRLAGLGAGLAASTKYAAVPQMVVLGAAVLLGVRGWRALGAGASFGLPAAVVALPWLMRQVLVLGNPLWPLYFGGRDWDAIRVEQLTYFVSQYGTGHTLRDWLLLPWNVYAQSWRFGHVPDSFPPYVALAAPLAALGARRAPLAGAGRRPLNSVLWLALVTAGMVAAWAAGLHDLRFLLGVYPLLSVLGIVGLVRGARLAGRARRWVALLPGAAVALLLALAAGKELSDSRDQLPVVLGREPVADYLRRQVPNEQGLEAIDGRAPAGGAVLFLGDGQIWYCRRRCVPDAAHDNLLQWFVRPGSPEASVQALRSEGISHILLSKRDYWYLEHQDPEQRLPRQLAAFYEFKARYLELIYEDPLIEVYEGQWR